MTKMWVEDESGRPYAVKKADLGGGGGGGSAATPEQMANGNATAPTITPQAGSAAKLLADILTKLNGSLNVSGSGVVKLTPVNASGTIATGGTSQQVAPATAGGQAVTLINESAFDMRVSDTVEPSATTGELVKPNGGGWVNVGYPGLITSEVRVWCATTGAKYTATRGVA